MRNAYSAQRLRFVTVGVVVVVLFIVVDGDGYLSEGEQPAPHSTNP